MTGIVYRIYVKNALQPYHCYIGKTRNLFKRMLDHVNISKISNCHINSFLLYSLYDKNDILVEELEHHNDICNDCLLKREQHFIKMYDCLNNYSINRVLPESGQNRYIKILDYEKTEQRKNYKKRYCRTELYRNKQKNNYYKKLNIF